ncbi:hypothetical protein KUCAC02_024384 [Chaenocephalus aceratus]|uniref:Uncharacterized protein n=1 Tax=Chaenocephalus aceratus TaxID=36190 RepID=A0ACB9WJ97_CHAAC|nr:hypothetical protein KUCAC02_024384 [Chaenocephalus aceratus]
MSNTNDESNDLLTSQAHIKSDVLLVLHKKHQVYKTGAELKAKRKRVSKHRVNSGDTTAAPDQDFGQLSRQSKTQKTYFCNKLRI